MQRANRSMVWVVDEAAIHLPGTAPMANSVKTFCSFLLWLPVSTDSDHSSLIAALTKPSMEGGMLEALIPWSFSACSAASFISSSSFSALISLGQFVPRSRQRSTFAIFASFFPVMSFGNSSTGRQFFAEGSPDSFSLAAGGRALAPGATSGKVPVLQ